MSQIGTIDMREHVQGDTERTRVSEHVGMLGEQRSELSSTLPAWCAASLAIPRIALGIIEAKCASKLGIRTGVEHARDKGELVRRLDLRRKLVMRGVDNRILVELGKRDASRDTRDIWFIGRFLHGENMLRDMACLARISRQAGYPRVNHLQYGAVCIRCLGATVK